MKSVLALLLFFSTLLAPVTVGAAEGTDPDFVLKAGVTCKLQRGKLFCGTTNDDENDNENGNNGDSPAAFSCARARCEPGMVVLEKPNRYGACCEAREGLPTPQSAEPEKCKFPGEVGTPPNCECPKDTVFLGYKGCVNCVSRCNEACGKAYEAADSCIATKGADACENERSAYMNCQAQCITSRCPDSGLFNQ